MTDRDTVEFAWYTLARLNAEGHRVPFSLRQTPEFKAGVVEYERIVASQQQNYPVDQPKGAS